MEMARNMLKGKNLSNEYWVEAVACAVYILNRSPTKIVRDMIPQQTWSSKHHNVSHFKVFGCIAYAHDLNKQGVNWLIKVKNAFLLVIINNIRHISCLIL
jgi:hypothetical protein